VLPPLNPFIPVIFDPGTPVRPSRYYSHWNGLASQLAEEMGQRGVVGRVALDPGTPDVRQWYWQGFDLGLAHTFQLALPWDASLTEPVAVKAARRAQSSGYRCEISDDLSGAEACLLETERRQGFFHRLQAGALTRLRELMGPALRPYVCRAPDGAIASLRIILWAPGTTAIDWIVGTRTEHLKSGATQLLLDHVLTDLTGAGAKLFDFEGADIASVAAAKQDWGATLVPYPTVRQQSIGFAFDTLRLGFRASPIGQRLIGPVRRIKKALRR
jgi:hypothetical protein